MSKSTHQVAIKGVDQTGAAFKSISARAKATGAQIRSIMGGAIAAAGAYLSFRSIKGGIEELGSLSDMAMKAGTSVEFLTKTSTAFQIAGLNVGTEQLVKSMQYLEKATGKTGEGAFYNAVEALAKIEDPAKRGAEATRMFGRSALELQPLINGGEEAVQKFRTLSELMPGVGTSAANAGDEAADALKTLGTGMHNLFLKVVGNIVGMWSEDFPGGVRAGALNAINYFEWGLKRMFNRATYWGARIGLAFNAWGNFLFRGYSWEAAGREHSELIRQLDNDLNGRLEEIDAARENYKAKLAQLSVDDLANAFGKNRGTSAAPLAEEIGTTAAKAAHRVTNQLMMGGSSAANRLAVLGPEYQNEAKKQTDLLRKIADNTEKTAENTDEASEGYASTDLN